MHKKIHLDIDYELFISSPGLEISSPLEIMKIDREDDYHQFGGMPKTFCFENTSMYQKFWSEEDCNYKELGDKLNIDVISVSTIMQPPGNSIPLHRDTFFKIKTKYFNDKRTIVRCNIFLEDWKVGHFLQYDNTIDTHWKKGDGHMWDSEVLHIGANVGMENKFTLQVSGFLG
jgi:hypothetical protein